MAVLYPNVNGNRCDYSSVEIALSPLGFSRVIGIKSINYKETLDPGEVYGTSAQMLGRTRGQLKVDGNIEIYREEFSDLLTALSGANGAIGYLEANFDITVSYSEGVFTNTDVVYGVRFKGFDTSMSQGKDPLVVKADFTAMYMLRNGLPPTSFRLGF